MYKKTALYSLLEKPKELDQFGLLSTEFKWNTWSIMERYIVSRPFLSTNLTYLKEGTLLMCSPLAQTLAQTASMHQGSSLTKSHHKLRAFQGSMTDVLKLESFASHFWLRCALMPLLPPGIPFAPRYLQFL